MTPSAPPPHRIRPRARLAGLLLAGLLGLAAGVGAQAETPRAGLVILDGLGQLHSFCVDLGAEEISGLELLRASGVDLVEQGILLGSMVCRIGRTGCDYPAEPCWCQCQSLGGDCRYWAYHQLEDGQWRYGLLGPSSRRVRHGEVDGWAWGPGSVVAGARPPLRSFEQICASSETGQRAPTLHAGSPAPPITAGPTSADSTPPAGPTASAPSRPGAEPETRLRATGVSSPSTRGAGRPDATPPTGTSEPAAVTDSRTPSAGNENVSADAGRTGTGEPGRATAGTGAEISDGSEAEPGAAAGTAAVAMAPAGRARPSAAGSDESGLAGPSATAAAPPDARRLAGYLIFGLIFLGLAGIALSGRRR